MKQVKFILPLLFFFACIGNVWSAEVSQVYSTGFESCTAGTSYQGTLNYDASSANGASWTIYYGTVSTSAALSGSKSAHMRLYSNKNAGYLVQTSDIANVDSISFKYAVSNKAVRFDVLYSTDQGSNWTKLESVVPSGTSTVTLQYKLSSRASNFRLKVLVTGGFPSSSNYTFRIDDIYYAEITTATPSTYTLVYAGMDGARHGTNQPTSGTIGTAFAVSAPTKDGFDFTGWTITNGLNTSTAKWGATSSPATAIASSSVKCFNGSSDVYFLDLGVKDASVTLTATWQAAAPSCTAVPTIGSVQPAVGTTSSVVLTCAGVTAIGENCEITSYGYVYGSGDAPGLNPDGTVKDGYTKYEVGTSYTTPSTAFANYTVNGVASGSKTYFIAYATNGAGIGVSGVTYATAKSTKDYYIDNVQSTDGYTGAGRIMNNRYEAPALDDIVVTAEQKASGTCEQQHYHFIGWVVEANKSNPTDANIIKAGTAMTAEDTPKNYFAVWAKEE